VTSAGRQVPKAAAIRVFDRLRRARGWDAEAYRRWLERMLTAALLSD
jgi:hypothetical protein